MLEVEVVDNYARVKFFRLVNGDSILGEVAKTFKHKLTIKNPMIIVVDADIESSKQIIFMFPWIPQGVAKGNACSINKKDIVMTAQAEEDITDYYNACVFDAQEDSGKKVISKEREYVDGDKKVVVFRDPKSPNKPQ